MLQPLVSIHIFATQYIWWAKFSWVTTLHKLFLIKWLIFSFTTALPIFGLCYNFKLSSCSIVSWVDVCIIPPRHSIANFEGWQNQSINYWTKWRSMCVWWVLDELVFVVAVAMKLASIPKITTRFVRGVKNADLHNERFHNQLNNCLIVWSHFLWSYCRLSTPPCGHNTFRPGLGWRTPFVAKTLSL